MSDYDEIPAEKGQVWRRVKDGELREVVWVTTPHGYGPYRRVQLRRVGAPNLKSTHWLDETNLWRLYRLVTAMERAEGS